MSHNIVNNTTLKEQHYDVLSEQKKKESNCERISIPQHK
jgi:hypothetical protein